MPYRRIFFEKYQPVHILSRAIEGKDAFKEEDDCHRFIFQFYVANLGSRGFNLKSQDIKKASQALLAGDEIPSKFVIKQHPPLVYLIDFSLVINHYHFYFLVNIKNGVPVLIQKLNGGFAKYFNLKHHRRDTLFGSRYKSIVVKTEFQSDAVSRYVRIINPLDVYQSGWREKGLKNWREASEFLENYQFSSFPDKIGKRWAKILAPKEILEKYSFMEDSKDKKEYLKFVQDFLKERSDTSPKLFLE